jgi:hypothetical protein
LKSKMMERFLSPCSPLSKRKKLAPKVATGAEIALVVTAAVLAEGAVAASEAAVTVVAEALVADAVVTEVAEAEIAAATEVAATVAVGDNPAFPYT